MWMWWAVLSFTTPALAVTDMRFDVDTFDATPEGSADHMNQTLFNDLNFTTIDGHVIAMGTDAHGPEIGEAGNELGSYYNTWTNIYNGQSTKSGADAADTINAYVVKGTTNGPKPTWVVLNEISGSLWPSSATYRQWVVDTATRLHDVYGYEVIAYAPFANPANNNSDWAALANVAYIGVENYLSGAEVKAQNFSLSWVQGQYASSIASYANRGVPASRLILGEEFANTVAGTGYGRDGVSQADWDATIRVRSQAIYNLNFAGFIGYAWSKNGMGLSDADMLDGEDTYRSTMVMPTEKPQWIVGGGGSWGVRNNWMAYATIPDGAGAAATFDRSMTGPSTVTLDGDRTVGALTLNNVNSITIAAGSGGTLTFDNGGATPTIAVVAGKHVIRANVAFAQAATLTISAGASLDVTGNALSLAVSGTPVGTLRQYLHDGRLFSSAADGEHGLGYGMSDSSTLVVKTTYLGDANLDGKVDADDYALIDRGFAQHGSTWAEGDFNYDGQVTAADYLLIDRVWMEQTGGFSPGFLSEREAEFGAGYVSELVASVPEPSVVGVAVIMMVGDRKRLQRGSGMM
jgi:hypothetical protein